MLEEWGILAVLNGFFYIFVIDGLTSPIIPHSEKLKKKKKEKYLSVCKISIEFWIVYLPFKIDFNSVYFSKSGLACAETG